MVHKTLNRKLIAIPLSGSILVTSSFNAIYKWDSKSHSLHITLINLRNCLSALLKILNKVSQNCQNCSVNLNPNPRDR